MNVLNSNKPSKHPGFECFRQPFKMVFLINVHLLMHFYHPQSGYLVVSCSQTAYWLGGKGPIAVYFWASPSTGDANWITLAAKGGANDILLSMPAGHLVCLFMPPFVAKVFQSASPTGWGCSEVNSYWSYSRPFALTQYMGKSDLATRE